MARQIEAVLRAKGGATQYQEGVTNVLYTQCTGSVSFSTIFTMCRDTGVTDIEIHSHSKVWGHLEMSLFSKEKHIFCPLK